MKVLNIAVATLTAIACITWLSYLGVQTGPSDGASLQDWLSTVVLIVAGIVPLCAAAISFRSVRCAAFLCFFGLLFVGVWLAGLRLAHASFPPMVLRYSVDSSSVKIEALLSICLLLLLPAIFWLMAGKLREPSALVAPLSLKWKATAGVAIIIALVIGIILDDAYSGESGECHFVASPFVGQQLAGQSVFTGHLIWTHLVWPSRAISEQHPELFRKYVAIAVVDRRFWGLPKLNGLVVLTYLERGPYHYYGVGQSYFIDGRRESGVLARVLPIFNVFCTRTTLLTDAQVDLRVIHDGAPRNSVRILGETLQSSSDYRLLPVSGARLVIDGPSGRTVVTSDQYGVYDAPNLPPGVYRIGSQLEDGQIVWQQPLCLAYSGQLIRVGEVRDCTVVIQ
jgi:hypothetical protein